MTIDAEANEDIRVLLNITIGDVAFFKRQQVTVTNYTMVLYGALAIINDQFLTGAAPWEVYTLCVFAVGIGVSSYVILYQLEGSILERRERLKRCWALLSPEFQEARKLQKTRGDWLVYLFWSVSVVGCVITVWLLIRSGT